MARYQLTPAQRFQLAQLFLHRDLTVTGVDESKRYNRTRLALGLSQIMDVIAYGKPLSTSLAEDHTPHAFELTDDQRDWIVEKVFGALPLLGHQAAMLGPFIEALETAKLLGQPPAVDVGPLEGPEDWADRGAAKPPDLRAV